MQVYNNNNNNNNNDNSFTLKYTEEDLFILRISVFLSQRFAVCEWSQKSQVIKEVGLPVL